LLAPDLFERPPGTPWAERAPGVGYLAGDSRNGIRQSDSIRLPPQVRHAGKSGREAFWKGKPLRLTGPLARI